MKILVLGGSGMLGRALVRELAKSHEVLATVRASVAQCADRDPWLAAARIAGDMDALVSAPIVEVLDRFQPAAVINAIGIVKQRAEGNLPLPLIEVNSLFPHRLEQQCGVRGVRLVHFSTDCVFSGQRGKYAERDLPDPVDLYGRSKLLGEVESPALTIRTSLLGLEHSSRRGLVEWFLAQRGTVRGFRRAVFSGLTTAEMARVVRRMVDEWPGLAGVWHLAAAPISKLELLAELQSRVGHDVQLLADEEVVCDRSLDASAFERRTGYRAPAWSTMLDELATEIAAREVKS